MKIGVRPFALAALLGFTLGPIAAACVEERSNPELCSNQQGDASCAERFPAGDLPYCAMPTCSSDPWGCVAEPPSADCHSPCGAGANASEDSSCIETADETASDSSSAVDDGDPECSSDADCIGAFCLDQHCVPCDSTPDPNMACADASGGATPVCSAGACVQCTSELPAACVELTPICEDTTHTCIGCDFHDQCPASACRVLDGSCLPSDRVWHVDGDGGQDFLGIGQALLQIGVGEIGTVVVHERSGGVAYQEALAIGDARVIALVAAPDERPFLENDVGTSLQVEAGAEVYLRGFLIAGIDPIHVDGASLILDECEVQGSVAAGVQLQADARLIARNTILLSSGSDNFFGPALTADASRFELVYSTVIGRLSNLAVLCSADTAGSYLRNSLIGSESGAAAIECAEITLLNNALEDASVYPGNVTIGEIQPEWFVGGTNYRLTSMAPIEIASAAIWQAGDPVADIDGEVRPARVGGPDFAGADRPVE